MKHHKDMTQDGKISPGFAARLDRMAPKQRVRAVLLLDTGVTARNGAKRQSPVERQRMVEETRRAAEEALGQIDSILRQHGGERLEGGASALGSVPVETTPEGIQALAGSEHIRAVLEDQGTSLVT